MAELLFFGLPDGQGEPLEQAAAGLQQRLASLSLQQQAAPQAAAPQPFDSSREYLYQDCLHGLEGRPPSEAAAVAAQPAAGQHPADQRAQQAERPPHFGPQWVLLRFSQPVTAAADSLVIGSKLDADLHSATCRLAFYGRLCAIISDPTGLWGAALRGMDQPARGQRGCPGTHVPAAVPHVPVAALQTAAGRTVLTPAGCSALFCVREQLKACLPGPCPPGADQQQLRRLLPIYKPKQREGVVERVEVDGCTAVCRQAGHRTCVLCSRLGSVAWPFSGRPLVLCHTALSSVGCRLIRFDPLSSKFAHLLGRHPACRGMFQKETDLARFEGGQAGAMACKLCVAHNRELSLLARPGIPALSIALCALGTLCTQPSPS